MDDFSLKTESKKDILDFKPKTMHMFKTVQYEYSQFFPVIRTNEGITLNFSVKAYSNAHILFSSTTTLWNGSSVYEIVLGANHNKHCTIRRKLLNDDKSFVKFGNIISGDEWRYFWIRISSNGLIEIGKRGNDLPFLLWKDNDPLVINYFSFSSWYDTAAFWTFQYYLDSSDDIDDFEVLSDSDVFHVLKKETS